MVLCLGGNSGAYVFTISSLLPVDHPHPPAAAAIATWLLQKSVLDDWTRVLFVENRMGLAIIIACVHFGLTLKFTLNALDVASLITVTGKTVRLFKFMLYPGVVWSALGLLMNCNVYYKRRLLKAKEEEGKRKLLSWGWPRGYMEEEKWH